MPKINNQSGTTPVYVASEPASSSGGAAAAPPTTAGWDFDKHMFI